MQNENVATSTMLVYIVISVITVPSHFLSFHDFNYNTGYKKTVEKKKLILRENAFICRILHLSKLL